MVQIPDIDSRPLSFGKYKGQSPNEIATNDPEYIIWLWENVDDAKTIVTKELVIACELDSSKDEANIGDYWSTF